MPDILLVAGTYVVIRRNQRPNMAVPRPSLLFLLYTNRVEKRWIEALLAPSIARFLQQDPYYSLALALQLHSLAWWCMALPVAVAADSALVGRRTTLIVLFSAKLLAYALLSLAGYIELFSPPMACAAALLLGCSTLASVPLHAMLGDASAPRDWIDAYKWLGLADFACDVTQSRLIALPLAMAGAPGLAVSPPTSYSSVWSGAVYAADAMDAAMYARVWGAVLLLASLGAFVLVRCEREWLVVLESTEGEPPQHQSLKVAASATSVAASPTSVYGSGMDLIVASDERTAVVARLVAFLCLHELTAFGRAYGNGVPPWTELHAAIGTSSWAYFCVAYVGSCVLVLPWMRDALLLKHGASYMAWGVACQLCLLVLGHGFSEQMRTLLSSGDEELDAPSVLAAAQPRAALLLCLTWVAIVLYFPQLRTFLRQTMGARYFCLALMCFEMLDEHANGAILLPALRATGWAPDATAVAMGVGSLAVATSLWALWGWVGAGALTAGGAAVESL